MYKQSRQERLHRAVDARSEQIKREGFPLVTFPLHLVCARVDIHRRRIALRQQGIRERREGLCVLRHDLIGDVIFLMYLHFEAVVRVLSKKEKQRLRLV